MDFAYEIIILSVFLLGGYFLCSYTLLESKSKEENRKYFDESWVKRKAKKILY